MKYGLSDAEFLFLFENLIAPLKDQKAKVYIFGSRATGKFKKFSDIDLLYVMEPRISLPKGFIYNLVSKIEESHFPYKIDIVNEADLASSYRTQIHSEKIEL